MVNFGEIGGKCGVEFIQKALYDLTLKKSKTGDKVNILNAVSYYLKY